MKKIITLLAALTVATSAFAQFGIVAGLTSSATDLKTAWADVKNVNQYHVGLTFKADLGLVAIQPSLVYNMKGMALGNFGVGDLKEEGGSTLNYKTGYLELPVQAQVGINVLDMARVYGFVEPFLGYAINNEVKLDIDTFQKVTDNWDNIKTRMEYGVSLGAGVELMSHLQLSVKYFWNLGNVYSADIKVGEVVNTVKESKCNGIAASLAFLF